MADVNDKQLAGHLAFLMFVGAARADANPEQRTRLRDEIKPMLDGFRETGNPEPTMRKVAEIMGEEWEPSGDWLEQIDLFLGRGSSDG
ncbi:MAG: hypothetical protein IPG16_02565 [Comamonadaceae bacterium]|nr:hypothetical protein [Comamonadaceae bacterium]